MNFLHATLLLLAAASAVFAEDIETLENVPGRSLARTVIHELNLTNAFDRALPSIRRYIVKLGLDPMEVPDVEVPLSHFPELFRTKMILHKGWMQQFSTIFRTGDIMLQYSNEKVSLYVNVGWDSLDLSHEYSLRFMLYTRRGSCYGRYHNVKARALFDYDLTTKKINLKFLKFVDVGKFDLKLEGHLIDGFLNVITKAVTSVFRTTVLRIIENKAYEEIDKHIQDINDLIPSPMDYTVVTKKVDKDYEFMNAVPYKVDGLGHM